MWAISFARWTKPKRSQRVASVVILASFLYTGTYAVLSEYGQYEASGLRFDAVDWYQWAPAGFVHNYHWRRSLFCAFLPLYVADREFWHTDEYAWRGRYRRHVPESIADLERAWRH